jgi:hypothetical protein
MQVMVLEQDQGFQAQLASALIEKGFQVICVESIGAAKNFIRLDIVDILVLGEQLSGRLSHSVALLAECRNPLVNAVLLTDRSGADLDEVFDLIPAVYAILGRGVAPSIVAQVVMASTVGSASDTVKGRLETRWAVAEAAAESATDMPLDIPEMAIFEQNEDGFEEQADVRFQLHVDVGFEAEGHLVAPAEDGFEAQTGDHFVGQAEDLFVGQTEDGFEAGDEPSLATYKVTALDETWPADPAALPEADPNPSPAHVHQTVDGLPAAPLLILSDPLPVQKDVTEPEPVADMDALQSDLVRINSAFVQSWLRNGKGPVFNRPLSDLPAFSAVEPPPTFPSNEATRWRLHLA